MKALILLIVVSVCYCSETGYSHVSKDHGYVFKSQQRNVIERPCAFYDVDCIRRVFAHNSQCKVVKGPAPDPYILEWLPIHLAHANVTFILKNAQVRGLHNWKITEFYLNKKTDKLVLEVEFNAVTVYCPKAIARFHRKGKESVELTDYSVVIYKGISLTLTVPHIKDLQISKAHVFPYIADSNPPYRVGAAIMAESDAELGRTFETMANEISTGLKEVFVYKGSLFMSVFLQSVICDFGQGESLL